MKKFLTYSIVAATIAWSMGISAILPAVASTGIVDGDIIKTATSNAVYYVAGGKKMLMVNRATYSSWSSAIGDTEDKFAGLKVVSQADFDAVPYGANITVRPGTGLIKFNDSADVFAVGTGAKLYKLADAAAQEALYPGVTPVTIFNSFRANYYNNGNPVATLTATSNYPDGTFIKSADAADVYVLEGGLRRPVSEDGWAANGLKMSFVRTTNVTTYSTGAAVTGKEAWSNVPVADAPVVTGSATVSLAATSPAATTIISGQAVADLAHFNFSGTGTVTGLKITKIGIASDATLDKVYLYDGNTKISDSGSVSGGVISFNNPAGLFSISGSKVISVKSDIAGSAGQLVGVSINSSADVSGVTVSGSFPVRGNLMSVAAVSDLARATTTMNSSVERNIDAGTANVTLWDARINVAERAVKMKYLALNMIGSAPADALKDVKLYVNGLNVASGVVNANRVLAFDLGAGVDLNTSGNQLIEVRGEIVKGTDRSFYLSLREVSDIVLVDSSYNVNIASAIVSGNGDTFKINKGQVSITVDPDFNTTQIIRTASNQTLGKWIIKAYGEDAKFMSVKASTTWAGSVASGDRVNNLSIWVNGAQVGSSQSYDLTVGGYKTYGSGNLFTVLAGQEATVEIRGDLSLNASGVTGLGSVLRIDDGQIQGVVSFHTAYDADANSYVSNPSILTVVDGAVTLERNNSYGAQTISPNTQAAKIGSFIISAGDADSVRVTNIRVGLTGSLSFATNTSNLYISETPNNKVNPQAINNFPVDFTLQPNQTRTIDVYANIGNVVSELGNNIVVTMDISARNSSNAIAYEGGAVNGQTISVDTGSLNTIAKSNDSMSSQYVIGGSQNVNSMIVNFRAGSSSVVIEEMGFVFNGDASVGAVPVTAITVGGVTRNVASSTATTTVTGLNITVPAGPSGLNVPVAVNYNSVGWNGNVDAGKYVSSTLVSVKYRVGNQSITTTTLSNLPVSSDDFLMVTTKPVVAFPSSGQPTTWSNGTTRVARITVTADPSGPILLKALPVKFSTTSANFNYDADKLIVKTAAGHSLTTENLAITGSGITTIVFDGTGLNISAGTTATLDIFVQDAAIVTPAAAGTHAIGVELGAKGLFSWTDVNGEEDITGAYYYGWPVEGLTVSR